MSIYIPETNVSVAGSSAARLVIPAASIAKAATTGYVTAFWIKTPAVGFDQDINRTILAKGGGVEDGSDGYIRINRAATTITARWRQFGIDYVGASGMSVSIIPGLTYLVMLLVTANNVHLVACAPGGSPIVTTTNSSAFYTVAVAGNIWDAVVTGTAGTGYYGPIEELCTWTGTFPETANVPDLTLIQNIANGTQSLDTLHSSLGSGTKKARYRMLTADDLADTFGVTTVLVPSGTSANRVLMSSGPLRPVALAPVFSSNQASQIVFSIPGSINGATAVINTPAGTYSGISPTYIQARLLKEDRTVLTTWETIATPSGGNWPESRFAVAQPLTNGWLEIQFKAVDGSLVQLGDTVSAFGLAGTGFNMVVESQSQGVVLWGTGSGASLTLPAGIRLQTTHFPALTYPDIPTAATTYNLSDAATTRLSLGIYQTAVEINALFPGVPISLTNIGVVGRQIEDFYAGGYYQLNWAKVKSVLGIKQPYCLTLYGHSSTTGGPTSAQYETSIATLRSFAESVMGATEKMILCPTARYAGAGTGGDYTGCKVVRTAMRDYVLNNSTNSALGGSWQTIKNDNSDVGPHPANLAVGHGRAGSYLAYALLGIVRAVHQQPLAIVSATPSGSTIRLKFGPVNTSL